MTITEAEPQVEVQAPPGDAAVLEDIVPYESVPEVSWHFSDIRQIFTDDKEHGYESAAHHLRWIKKFVGEVALFGAISAAGGGVTAVVATLNSPSRGAIGPQYTHITPTRDNALTIDFGLGQQIILPLSGENGIGAKVEPIGTPDLVNIKLGDPTAQQDATTLLENALGNPDQYTSEGKRAVAGHGKGWFELGGAATLGLSLGLYRLLGPSRRAELLQTSFSPGRRRLGAAALVIFASSINPFDTNSAEQARSIPANPAFETTALKGAHVKGDIISSVVDDLLPAINNWRTTTNQTFDEIMHHYRDAIELHPLLKAHPGTKTELLLGNEHCNFPLYPIYNEIANDSGADIVENVADNELGNQTLDNVCTDSFAFSFKGKTIVVTPGNHRSPGTIARSKQDGMTTLDGIEVQEINGRRYVGTYDRNISDGKHSIHQEGPESNAQAGVRLADVACADKEGVDVVFAPTEEEVMPTLLRDCAKMGIIGTREAGLRMITTKNGNSVPLHTGANTGGVVTGQLSVGTLDMQSNGIIIERDAATNKPLAYQQITLEPDHTVVVGDFKTYD